MSPWFLPEQTQVASEIRHDTGASYWSRSADNAAPDMSHTKGDSQHSPRSLSRCAFTGTYFSHSLRSRCPNSRTIHVWAWKRVAQCQRIARFADLPNGPDTTS